MLKWIGVLRRNTTIVLDRESGTVTVTPRPQWTDREVAIAVTNEMLTGRES